MVFSLFRSRSRVRVAMALDGDSVLGLISDQPVTLVGETRVPEVIHLKNGDILTLIPGVGAAEWLVFDD